ncbi:hypothetical protein HYC85_023859 [Camellia sinensis]|uniref:NB-ARC domain-containing protein n=1 Tax=Camellia sinensis TaxID=4442 RepID=A0A7J7GFR5_CAMSI|nr:hypothetical protein HYC85_023859 [Camellia sinensis]
MENRTMVHEEITVGFDDEALTIKQLLAGGKKQLQMISIVGMPGLGKTTLPTKLYNDPYITHYFHIRAWTYASQLPRITDMLLDILRSVNVVFTDEIKNMTNEKLGEKLYKQLKGQRYLIVIDDLWDIGAWIPKLRHLYAKGGAKVDVSLCSEEAAVDQSYPRVLKDLRTITDLDPCGSVQDFLARTPYLTKLGICVHLLSASGNLMFPNLEFLGHLDTLKLYREFLHSTYLRETVGEDIERWCHNVVEDTGWVCHNGVEDTGWWCHNVVEDTVWWCHNVVEDTVC